jgi:DNA topoisomerase-1
VSAARAVARRAATAPAPPALAEVVDAARSAGLRYVSASPLPPGVRRLRHGRAGFRYLAPDGSVVNVASELARIRALAIPPAWTDVWICASATGHIQAMGRDARGRKQYRYHARWREVRDETKYGLLVAFGKALPAIRRRVRADLARAGLPREKVIAVVVQLLDLTMMRIGNEEYARANRSFGLTTLRDRHVRFPAGALEFHFRGKSGKEHRVRIADPRLARIVKACQDIPGNELFQYLDAEGGRQSIDSSDVNAYLRELGGPETSAKVFRTWAGTVQALGALRTRPPVVAETTQADTARTLVEIVKEVAARLGNTPAVSRKAYIHPAVIECYQRGELHARLEALSRGKTRTARLDADERLTLAFLAQAGKRAGRGGR